MRRAVLQRSLLGQGAGLAARWRAFAGWAPLAIALALLVASCATVPPPVGPEPQPGEPVVPPPPTPAPTPGVPAAPEIHEEPMIDVGIAWDLDSLRIEMIEGSGVSLQLAGAFLIGTDHRGCPVPRPALRLIV